MAKAYKSTSEEAKMRHKYLIFAGALALVLALSGFDRSELAHAADDAKAPAPTTANPSSQHDLAKDFEALNKDLDDSMNSIQDAVKSLDKATGSTPEAKKEELDRFKAKLLELDKKIQSNSPFSEKISEFEAYVNSQIARLNNSRNGGLTQEDIEELISVYKGYSERISAMRSALKGQTQDIQSALQELTRSEVRVIEWMRVDDVAKAMAALEEAVNKVKATVESIRQKAQGIGRPGA
jgi:DNA repair ATPase RecN